MTLWLFGYGSLLFSPELPGKVKGRVPARLSGHRRGFNKLSTTRFTPVDASFDAFPPPDPRFVHGNAYRSLVLGTEPDDGGAIDAMVIGYPVGCREELLRVTDRREGWDPARASRENGYVRSEEPAVRSDTGEALRCLVYLSNPDPDCLHRVSELTLEQRARAIINATPLVRGGEADSRGLHYLEGVRAQLRGIGVIDRALEDLAAAIRSHDGPWVELVAPPRPPATE